MEIEFKFVVPPERRPAVEAALRRGAVTRTRMQARYFDTPDRALATRGIVLRLRKEGRRWVQTVKAAADGVQGPLHREEHNVDLGLARAGAQPVPDAQRHHGTAAGERLATALADTQGPLAETYATDIWRLKREVRVAGGTVVELAFDLGKVIAHAGTPEARESAVCELELELLRGPVAGLVALAQRWSQRHRLWFSTVSKAERGERLLAQADTVPAVKAAAPRDWPDDAPPDGRALQRAMVAHCLAQILPNASEVAAGSEDEEQVHQLRIGIRRLRTALRELADLDAVAFDVAAWERPLVEAFRALGALRDRSQVLQHIAPLLHEAGAPPIALPPDDTPTPPAGDVVRAPVFQAALVTLIGFAADDIVSATALDAKDTRRLLRNRLRKLHARTVHDGERFEGLPTEAQHRVRKRLKRLRYLGEFVAPLFDAGRAARYVERLRPAQDALGDFNDEAVAGALYRAVVAHDPAAWFAVGWLAARHPAGARDCHEALGRLADAPRFWRKKKK